MPFNNHLNFTSLSTRRTLSLATLTLMFSLPEHCCVLNKQWWRLYPCLTPFLIFHADMSIFLRLICFPYISIESCYFIQFISLELTNAFSKSKNYVFLYSYSIIKLVSEQFLLMSAPKATLVFIQLIIVDVIFLSDLCCILCWLSSHLSVCAFLSTV